MTGNDRWCLVEHPENLSRNMEGRDMTYTSKAHIGDVRSHGECSTKTPSQRPKLKRKGSSHVIKAPDLLTGAEVKTWVEEAEMLRSELNGGRRGRRARPLI